MSLISLWADGDYARLQSIAAELVNRQVSVIIATGGDAVALAAMTATTYPNRFRC
jgi:putative ABC transport system substrate-binding protein